MSIRRIAVASLLALVIAAASACSGNQSPGLSGAQRERCNSLQRTVENFRSQEAEMQKYLGTLQLGQRDLGQGAMDAIVSMGKSRDTAEKERASLGCP